MTISRIVSQLSKHVGPAAWKPRAAGGPRASCRCISLCLDHKRYDNKGIEGTKHFVGTWVQDSHEGYQPVLKAFGVRPGMIDYLLANKTVLRYGREGHMLTLTQSVQGAEQGPIHKLELGDYFLSVFYDGRSLNSVIFEYKGCLVEQHETVYMPTLFMKVVRELDDSGNTMTCTKKVGPNFMKKVYKKR